MGQPRFSYPFRAPRGTVAFTPNVLGDATKSTLATERYIVKGTTARLPGIALNEHLCMKVAERAFGYAAKTEVSDDGQALVVHRFDTFLS